MSTKIEKLKKELSVLSKKKSSLSKSISGLSAKESKITALIEKEKNKNKPKSIMEIVFSFEDALKYTKKKASDVYDEKRDTIDEIAYKRLKFTIKVLNEGHKFKMDGSEKRYFPYHWLSPSGFAFYGTACNATDTDASSASRLALKSDELARHAGEYLNEDWKNFIM